MPELAIQPVRSMPLLTRLKSILHQRAINRFRTTNLSQAPAGHFKSIKSVGILFNAAHAADRDIILGYAAQLRAQNISVRLFGFIDAKVVGIDFDFDFIDVRNLTFAQIPKGEIVQKFISERFDVLINLDTSMQKPLNYIAAASKALFKIGPAAGDHRHYDLMIAAPDHDLSAYILQIRTTFNKIQG